MMGNVYKQLFFLLVLSSLLACTTDETGEQNVQPAKVVMTGDAQIDGEKIYADNCLSCHAAGPGHPGTMRLAIRLGDDRAVLAERDDLPVEYIKTIVRQGIMLMPPFRPSEITDPELDALANYLARKNG